MEAFEKTFTSYLGEGGGAVGVNSGTDEIAIALRALDIRAGDEVVTVANTAVPTVSAIREVGAIPVFCDVEPDTALIDLRRLEACINSRTRAIIPVHLFGNVVDVSAIMELIGNRSISVVEDCAQAHGGKLSGRMAGTFGQAAAFSFYPTKNLGAYGDAGICYSRDPELAARMRSIRTYGFEDRYCAEREGVNSRLDPIQAAVLRIKLTRLPEYVCLRQKIAARSPSPAFRPKSPRFKGIRDQTRPASLRYTSARPRPWCGRRLAGSAAFRPVSTIPFLFTLCPPTPFSATGPEDLSGHRTIIWQWILSLPLYPELGGGADRAGLRRTQCPGRMIG